MAKRMLKKEIVLEAIRRSGGMRREQISQLYVMMAGLDWEARDSRGLRKWRGYCSGTISRLVKEHCVKRDGVYVVPEGAAAAPPTDAMLRAIPQFRERYERERRALIRRADSRLPPGPFDEVGFRVAHWHPGATELLVHFEDSRGPLDNRWLTLRLPWPLPEDPSVLLRTEDDGDGDDRLD